MQIFGMKAFGLDLVLLRKDTNPILNIGIPYKKDLLAGIILKAKGFSLISSCLLAGRNIGEPTKIMRNTRISEYFRLQVGPSKLQKRL